MKTAIIICSIIVLTSCSLQEDIHHYTPSTPVPSVPVGKQHPDYRKSINQLVPFSVQAPDGDWASPLRQDGCEEMSVIMAVQWVQGALLTPKIALDELLSVSAYEDKEFGSNKDTSAEDTMERLLKGHYNLTRVSLLDIAAPEDLKKPLYEGKIIIAPMNGKKLNNPYFSNGGPEKHMIVITGYDVEKRQFIVNDPGTKRGERFVYAENMIMDALYNYPTTGKKKSNHEKRVIVVGR